MEQVATIILAAGKGTRMKSKLPKVLHQVCGQPMIKHVMRAAEPLNAQISILIVGFGADQVREQLGSSNEYVEQSEQLGTGHAVMQAMPLLQDMDGTVVVLCGDTPLLRSETLCALLDYHRLQQHSATVLTAQMENPSGYGRIVRNTDQTVSRIVEQKDATAEQQQIREINTGIYCFDRQDLAWALARIDNDNAQHEYYLTDAIGILVSGGKTVGALMTQAVDETLGVNSRQQLAQAEQILRRRKVGQLMDSGVTIMDPNTTFVDWDVRVASDSVLLPFTWLEAGTKIGGDCEIGPNVRIRNTSVGSNVRIHFATIADSAIDDGANVGPFVHIRPDSHIGPQVRVGNFVEVKNSTVGEGSKLPHLSYIGDADIGCGVNVGCGAITVNYDGKTKHRTVMEDDAFVGCNSNLVAPVTVGRGAYVAAGSTVTKNVPPNSLAVGRAQQKNISGWVERRK